MDIMTVSLTVLAVCSLTQLGFFIYDRVQHSRIMRELARRPSSTGYSFTTLLLVCFGGYLVGLLVRRAIEYYVD